MITSLHGSYTDDHFLEEKRIKSAAGSSIPLKRKQGKQSVIQHTRPNQVLLSASNQSVAALIQQLTAQGAFPLVHGQYIDQMSCLAHFVEHPTAGIHDHSPQINPWHAHEYRIKMSSINLTV
jgi:hypothetical protein